MRISLNSLKTCLKQYSAAPNDVLHSVPGARGEDFVDVVMASPSLEVGVDLPNLTESIMTKAVRNLASYRQKAGRVGRESLSEAVNLTLATDSTNDLHYYRQPRKLIDRGRLEPVPLKKKMKQLLNQQHISQFGIYWLSVESCLRHYSNTPPNLRIV